MDKIDLNLAAVAYQQKMWENGHPQNSLSTIQTLLPLLTFNLDHTQSHVYKFSRSVCQWQSHTFLAIWNVGTAKWEVRLKRHAKPKTIVLGKTTYEIPGNPNKHYATSKIKKFSHLIGGPMPLACAVVTSREWRVYKLFCEVSKKLAGKLPFLGVCGMLESKKHGRERPCIVFQAPTKRKEQIDQLPRIDKLWRIFEVGEQLLKLHQAGYAHGLVKCAHIFDGECGAGIGMFDRLQRLNSRNRNGDLQSLLKVVWGAVHGLRWDCIADKRRRGFVTTKSWDKAYQKPKGFQKAKGLTTEQISTMDALMRKAFEDYDFIAFQEGFHAFLIA